MTKKIYLLLTVFMLAALALSCGSGESQSKSDQKSPAVQTAKTDNNPDIIEFSAYDINGKLHNSSEWIGKQPVVINFWGTWCPPCRMEMPDLVKLYNEYNLKGVEVLGLAVKDRTDKVFTFAQDYKMKWVLLMAENKILIDYNAIEGIPTTIFLDRNGNEVGRYIGMRNYTDLKKGFESIL